MASWYTFQAAFFLVLLFLGLLSICHQKSQFLSTDCLWIMQSEHLEMATEARQRTLGSTVITSFDGGKATHHHGQRTPDRAPLRFLGFGKCVSVNHTAGVTYEGQWRLLKLLAIRNSVGILNPSERLFTVIWCQKCKQPSSHAIIIGREATGFRSRI